MVRKSAVRLEHPYTAILEVFRRWGGYGGKFLKIHKRTNKLTTNEDEKTVDVHRFLYGHRDWINILTENQ
jgi:hypothetical protein